MEEWTEQIEPIAVVEIRYDRRKDRVERQQHERDERRYQSRDVVDAHVGRHEEDAQHYATAVLHEERHERVGQHRAGV